MKLAVTIDVEEEGLFRGTYGSEDISTTNVGSLEILDSIFQDYGIRPTLLVSYQVAREVSHHGLLLRLRDRWKGEIGAHLHHWNTPPIRKLPFPDPVCSQVMPRDLLESKLDSLLAALGNMGVKPTSFRMGRFNLGTNMLSVLEATHLDVDSSIAPMRKEYGGPDHLAAPSDPYFPDPEDPCRPGSSRLLEIPITVLPLTPRLGRFLERVSQSGWLPESAVAWSAKYALCLSVQPVGIGLQRLKLGAWLHRQRGGRVLNLFFHSSELIPGGCPEHHTRDDVDAFLKKLGAFMAWLRGTLDVEPLTLTDIGRMYRAERFAGTDGRSDKSGAGTELTGIR